MASLSLLKVPGLTSAACEHKRYGMSGTRWQLGAFPWWRWRSEMGNRPTWRTLFLGFLEFCDKC